MKNLELLQQIKFCEQYGINPNELLLFQILLLVQEDDDDVSEYFKLPVCSKGNTREMLIKLQDCGLINKTFKIPATGTSFDPHDIPLNKNVIKNYYKCSFELGKELFENYPLSTVVNNIEFKLRRVSKKFDSLEDAYKAYGKAIGWNPEKHNHIMDLLKQGIETGYQFTTLGDFIVDHDWVNMEALAVGGVMSNSNMTLL